MCVCVCVCVCVCLYVCICLFVYACRVHVHITAGDSDAKVIRLNAYCIWVRPSNITLLPVPRNLHKLIDYTAALLLARGDMD